jgi:hypothetical protein
MSMLWTERKCGTGKEQRAAKASLIAGALPDGDENEGLYTYSSQGNQEDLYF